MAWKHVHSSIHTDWEKRWFWTWSQNRSILWKTGQLESYLTKPNLGVVCVQIAPMPRHIVTLQCQQQIYQFKPTKSCRITQNTTHFLPGNWKNSSHFMLSKATIMREEYIQMHEMWLRKKFTKNRQSQSNLKFNEFWHLCPKTTSCVVQMYLKYIVHVH